MGNTPNRPILVAFVLVLALLAIGGLTFFVPERFVEGESRWSEISPDTFQYMRMMAGEMADVPFRYRPIVPAIASALPLPPLDALAWISHVCLFGALATLARTILHLGLSPLSAGLALLGFCTTTRALYFVQNPFGPDTWGLLATTVMLHFLVAEKPFPFALAALVGIPGREEVLFGAPSFIPTRAWRLGLVITVLCFGLFFWLRLGDAPKTAAPGGFFTPGNWHYYAKIYFAFGAFWWLAIMGALLAGNLGIARLAPYVGLVLGGALVSTVFAADTVRVFLPVLPVATVFAAVAFERLAEFRAPLVFWVFVLLFGAVLAVPNVILPETVPLHELEDWYASLKRPILMQFALTLVGVAWAVASLRGPLLVGIKSWWAEGEEFWAQLRTFVWRAAGR